MARITRIAASSPHVSIHSGDPFAVPEAERSGLRRLRARLVAPVTLWTAGDSQGRAGLTVASTLVVDGDPGRVLGLIDPESELWQVAQRTGALTMTPMSWRDQHLADVFGGLAPAPGGPFGLAEWRQTRWGPVLAAASTWCGARLDDWREVGYAVLVDAVVEQVEVGEDEPPLAHYRGRYRGLELGS